MKQIVNLLRFDRKATVDIRDVASAVVDLAQYNVDAKDQGLDTPTSRKDDR